MWMGGEMGGIRVREWGNMVRWGRGEVGVDVVMVRKKGSGRWEVRWDVRDSRVWGRREGRGWVWEILNNGIGWWVEGENRWEFENEMFW